MSLNKFTSILTTLDCNVEIEGNKINLDIENNKIWLEVPDNWTKAINSFFKAKQYKFDEVSRTLIANKYVEYLVVRLNPSFLPRPDHKFTNKKNDIVTVKQASKMFILSFYASKLYFDDFEIIKKRIERRCRYRAKNKNERIRIRFEDLLLIPNTATYAPKRKLKKRKLSTIGREKIKSCLFNLAYSTNECWEIRDEIKAKPLKITNHVYEEDGLEIPAVTYNEDLAKYYKIAKSSQFPGQAFLSYYHILEYYFLRVSDDFIVNSLKSQLNRPNFKPTYGNINNLLSIIKKHDNNLNDETEMLKLVLRKFVQEDELIKFLIGIEEELGDKIYSNTKSEVFGEKMYIKLAQGHALSNVARIIKHIRNSLVHSSDRHNRNDCFLPFSETESTVMQYIPIVKYLAEKIIFVTAK